jgi:nucleotide-binding universal stress UspA family protein
MGANVVELLFTANGSEHKDRNMKIVLAVDASPAAEAAISDVIVRPWAPGTHFDVVTVADTAHLPVNEGVSREIVEVARQIAERTASRLKAEGLDAAACWKAGDPKTAILDHATDVSADWIIVGNHSAGIEGFLLGSVAKSLIRHAPCPVEIVRPSKWRTDDEPGRRILLATDGSESAMQAAYSVAGALWPAGTQVRIVSAVELTTSLLHAIEPPYGRLQEMEDLRERAMQRAQNAIGAAHEVLAQAPALDISEHISVLLEKPAKIILDEGKRWGADLIVCGSHGRRGWSRLWLGSVSEAIAMHAECSVQVIRPRGRQAGAQGLPV